MQRKMFQNLRPVALSRSNLHNQIAKKIGSLITQGTIEPGAVLPNEDSLSAKFGVSRTALREAVKVLASKGLIEVRRKIGTRVKPRSEWNLLDPDVLSWVFSGNEIAPVLRDLMEVRKTIEPAAARMAANHATDGDVERIAAAFTEMEVAINDLPSSVEPDLKFHLTILSATHNMFMKPFGALIQTALRTSFSLTSSNSVAYERTLALHRAVLDAIRLRDGEGAAGAMNTVLAQTSADIDSATHDANAYRGRIKPGDDVISSHSERL